MRRWALVALAAGEPHPHRGAASVGPVPLKHAGPHAVQHEAHPAAEIDGWVLQDVYHVGFSSGRSLEEMHTARSAEDFAALGQIQITRHRLGETETRRRLQNVAERKERRRLQTGHVIDFDTNERERVRSMIRLSRWIYDSNWDGKNFTDSYHNGATYWQTLYDNGHNQMGGSQSTGITGEARAAAETTADADWVAQTRAELQSNGRNYSQDFKPVENMEQNLGVAMGSYVDDQGRQTLVFRGTFGPFDAINTVAGYNSWFMHRMKEQIEQSWLTATGFYNDEQLQRSEQFDGHWRVTWMFAGTSGLAAQDMLWLTSQELNLDQKVETVLSGYWPLTKQLVLDAYGSVAKPSDSVFITGHSQGGMRAHLTGIWLSDYYRRYHKSYSMSGLGVQCAVQTQFPVAYERDIDTAKYHSHLIHYTHVLDPFGNIDFQVGKSCKYGVKDVQAFGNRSHPDFASNAHEYCSRVVGENGARLMLQYNLPETEVGAAFSACVELAHIQRAQQMFLERDDILAEDGTTDGGCVAIPEILTPAQLEKRCPPCMSSRCILPRDLVHVGYDLLAAAQSVKDTAVATARSIASTFWSCATSLGSDCSFADFSEHICLGQENANKANANNFDLVEFKPARGQYKGTCMVLGDDSAFLSREFLPVNWEETNFASSRRCEDAILGRVESVLKRKADVPWWQLTISKVDPDSALLDRIMDGLFLTSSHAAVTQKLNAARNANLLTFVRNIASFLQKNRLLSAALCDEVDSVLETLDLGASEDDVVWEAVHYALVLHSLVEVIDQHDNVSILKNVWQRVEQNRPQEWRDIHDAAQVHLHERMEGVSLLANATQWEARKAAGSWQSNKGLRVLTFRQALAEYRMMNAANADAGLSLLRNDARSGSSAKMDTNALTESYVSFGISASLGLPNWPFSLAALVAGQNTDLTAANPSDRNDPGRLLFRSELALWLHFYAKNLHAFHANNQYGFPVFSGDFDSMDWRTQGASFRRNLGLKNLLFVDTYMSQSVTLANENTRVANLDFIYNSHLGLEMFGLEPFHAKLTVLYDEITRDVKFITAYEGEEHEYQVSAASDAAPICTPKFISMFKFCLDIGSTRRRLTDDASNSTAAPGMPEVYFEVLGSSSPRMAVAQQVQGEEQSTTLNGSVAGSGVTALSRKDKNRTVMLLLSLLAAAVFVGGIAAIVYGFRFQKPNSRFAHLFGSAPKAEQVGRPQGRQMPDGSKRYHVPNV